MHLLPVPLVAVGARAGRNLLGAQELLQPPATELPAEAALLVATPGGLDERRLRAVLPDDAGAKPQRHALAPGTKKVGNVDEFHGINPRIGRERTLQVVRTCSGSRDPCMGVKHQQQQQQQQHHYQQH